MPLPFDECPTLVFAENFVEASDTKVDDHDPEFEHSGWEQAYTEDSGDVDVIAAEDELEGVSSNSSNETDTGISLPADVDVLIVCDYYMTNTPGTGNHVSWGPFTIKADADAADTMGSSCDNAGTQVTLFYETDTDGFSTEDTWSVPSAFFDTKHQHALHWHGDDVDLYIDGTLRCSMSLVGTDLAGHPAATLFITLGNYVNAFSYRSRIDNLRIYTEPEEGFDDFGGHSTGSLPSDWSEVDDGGTGGTSVATLSGSVSGKALKITRSAGNVKRLAYLSAAPRFIEGEVLALIRVDAAFARGGVWAAVQEDMGANPPDGFGVGYYNGGAGLDRYPDSSSTLAVGLTGTTHTPNEDPNGERVWVRFQFRRDLTNATILDFKYRTWLFADSEPGTWDQEDTDQSGVDVAEEGHPGVFANLQGTTFGDDFYCEYFGWATGQGVTAPMPSGETDDHTEGAEATDTHTALLGKLSAQADAVDAVDSHTAAAARLASGSDGVEAADSQTSTVNRTGAHTEGVTASDVHTVAAGKMASGADGVEAADAHVAALDRVAGTTDAVDALDAHAAARARLGDESDGVTAADVHASLVARLSGHLEGVEAGDVHTAALALTAALASGAIATDVHTSSATRIAAHTEGATASDSHTAEITGESAGFVTDGIHAADVHTSTRVRSVAIAEAVEAGDVHSAVLALTAAVLEGVDVSDLHAAVAARIAAEASAALAADAHTGARARTGASSDGVAVSDVHTAVASGGILVPPALHIVPAEASTNTLPAEPSTNTIPAE